MVKGKMAGFVLALMVIMVWSPARLEAQSKEKGPAGKKPAAAHKAEPSPEAMMAEYMKYAAPGEGHARLKALEGSWNTATKAWMGPGAPTETKGTSEKKWILEGRFLQEDYTGDFMGKTFMGRGLLGFDNYKKQYIGLWTDTMSTTVWIGRGTADPSGKSIAVTGPFDDVMSGKKKTARAVTRIVDENKHIFEWYEPGPDGKEVKTMEVTYTRK